MPSNLFLQEHPMLKICRLLQLLFLPFPVFLYSFPEWSHHKLSIDSLASVTSSLRNFETASNFHVSSGNIFLLILIHWRVPFKMAPFVPCTSINSQHSFIPLCRYFFTWSPLSFSLYPPPKVWYLTSRFHYLFYFHQSSLTLFSRYQ